MQIMKFKSMDELVERANKSVYGLGAGVVTRDIDKALYLANSLRSGTVWSALLSLPPPFLAPALTTTTCAYRCHLCAG